MRGVVLVIVQVVISFLVVGAVLPVVLVAVPATQQSVIGPLVAIITMAVVFVLLRVAWPRSRQGQ